MKHTYQRVLVHIWQNGFTECTYVRDGYFGQFQRNKSRNSHPHILVIYPQSMNFTYIICFFAFVLNRMQQMDSLPLSALESHTCEVGFEFLHPEISTPICPSLNQLCIWKRGTSQVIQGLYTSSVWCAACGSLISRWIKDDPKPETFQLRDLSN